MYAQNELPTIVTWVMTLPDDLFQARPSLALKAAWAWLATTHVEETEHALQAVEHAVHLQADVLMTEPAANLSPQVRAALVEVTVIRASIMMPQFDFAEKIKRLERILPWLTDDAAQVNNRPADLIPVVIFNLALAHELIGNSDQASQLFACPTPHRAH
jgi:ATP/maltotriose-dependent transcriptional regulator MalT